MKQLPFPVLKEWPSVGMSPVYSAHVGWLEARKVKASGGFRQCWAIGHPGKLAGDLGRLSMC